LRSPWLGDRPSAPADSHGLRGLITGSSLGRTLRLERQGSPRLLGRPLHARRCQGTPSDALALSPYIEGSATAFMKRVSLGIGDQETFEVARRGSHARVPTHQRRRCRRRCKAGYRPAGLGFSRAGFAPAGRLLRILTTYRILVSFRTSMAWSLPRPSQRALNPCGGRCDHPQGSDSPPYGRALYRSVTSSSAAVG